MSEKTNKLPIPLETNSTEKTEIVFGAAQEKLKKMDRDTEEWQDLANSIARDRCPMVSCKHCGGPRVSGYICERCGYE